MAGRPRKPYRLRVLEGGREGKKGSGRGKSRPLTPDLPAPRERMVMPTGLSKAEQNAWKVHVGRIRTLKIESGVDAGALEALVRFYCRARAADKLIADQGTTMETEANGTIRRPEVTISRECWRDYASLCSQFGLTPAARAKLGAGGKAPDDAGDVLPELSDASGGGS